MDKFMQYVRIWRHELNNQGGMEAELFIDVAYCSLRSLRTGNDSMIPGRSFKCSYSSRRVLVELGEIIVKIYKEDAEIIPELIFALQNVTTNYAQVISLGPSLFLVEELLKRERSLIIPVLCSIKHFEMCRQTLGVDSWCCKLHKSIANQLEKRDDFERMCDFQDDDVLFGKFIELFGAVACLKTRQRMFMRLCDSKKVTLKQARAIVTKNFHQNLPFQLNCRLSTFFSNLFREIEPKFIMFLIARLPLDDLDDSFLEREDLRDKYWWMIHFCRLSKLSYPLQEAFLNATMVPEEEQEPNSIATRFYRGVLNRILKSPRAFWPHLLPQLKAPISIAGVVSFDEKLAMVLFCSKESALIFEVVYERCAVDLLPFTNFPIEYIRVGLTRGHYRKIAKTISFQCSLWTDLKEVVRIFQSANLKNLNELLDFKLTNEFVPLAISMYDYSFIDSLVKLPSELSIDLWKEVTLRTDYWYRCNRKDVLEYLFKEMGICSADIVEKSVQVFLNPTKRKEYIEQVFDPENTKEYRLLLLHPSRASVMYCVFIDFKTFDNPLSSSHQDIREVCELFTHFVDEFGGKQPWRALSKMPLGAALHSNSFWRSFVRNFFSETLCDEEARLQFCNEVTKETLIFLREVYLISARYEELNQDGREEEANQMFFDFILGISNAHERNVN